VVIGHWVHVIENNVLYFKWICTIEYRY